MAELDQLTEELSDYQPFHAARAEFLTRLGRKAEASAAYDSAIALAASSADAEFLTLRRDGGA
jgi:predicted RNA polymerase sigma factor